MLRWSDPEAILGRSETKAPETLDGETGGAEGYVPRSPACRLPDRVH